MKPKPSHDCWSFQHSGELWTWSHRSATTGQTSESSKRSKCLLECIRDAKLHGYEPEALGRGMGLEADGA